MCEDASEQVKTEPEDRLGVSVSASDLEILLKKWRGRFIEKEAEANNARPGSLSLLHIEANAAAYIRCYADLNKLVTYAYRSRLEKGLNKDGQG